MAVNVTYDTNSNVFCAEIADGAVARTVEFDENHLVDLSDGGRVLAIEVLDPDNARLKEVAGQFGLADQLPELLEAVEAAIPVSPTATFTGKLSSFVSEPEIRYVAPSAQFRMDLGNAVSVQGKRPRELDLAASTD